MITLILKNDEAKTFNLKNFEREKTLKSAWWSMRDDEKYKNKVIKLTLKEGEFKYKISDIEDCIFEECVSFEQVKVKSI